MPKSYVFRVRLDQSEIEHLERLAEEKGTTKAQAVRFAIKLVLRLLTGDKYSPESLPAQDHSETISENENSKVIHP